MESWSTHAQSRVLREDSQGEVRTVSGGNRSSSSLMSGPHCPRCPAFAGLNVIVLQVLERLVQPRMNRLTCASPAEGLARRLRFSAIAVTGPESGAGACCTIPPEWNWTRRRSEQSSRGPVPRTCPPVLRFHPKLRTCSQIMTNDSTIADFRICGLVPTIFRTTDRSASLVPGGVDLMRAFADSQTKTNFKNL